LIASVALAAVIAAATLYFVKPTVFTQARSWVERSLGQESAVIKSTDVNSNSLVKAYFSEKPNKLG
jgi:hypothetical protein